jgi:hypothetical protein
MHRIARMLMAMFTANGLSVGWRARTSARNPATPSGIVAALICPNPPAFDTAAHSSTNAR